MLCPEVSRGAPKSEIDSEIDRRPVVSPLGEIDSEINVVSRGVLWCPVEWHR